MKVKMNNRITHRQFIGKAATAAVFSAIVSGAHSV